MSRSQPTIRDFYVETVLPVIAERLDIVFPEFGWKRDGRGWVATNEETTHAVFGVRAERVVAHGPAPRGFLIHGGDATLWTTYVNGGVMPRGEAFARTVRELASRTGIDTSQFDDPRPRSRKGELLDDFFALCCAELHSSRGGTARTYLEHRGISASDLDHLGLGLVPDGARSQSALRGRGYSATEIQRAGILADSRWQGRIAGAWRDEHGHIGTLWARRVERSGDNASPYLYLRGSSRHALPPYGLGEVLVGVRDRPRHVALVEGLFDVHQLRGHGVREVGALGGTSVRPATFELLNRLGVETVTLCFDNDTPGRTATARAVDCATRARQAPALYVIDPAQLGTAKDPDELIRERGVSAWQELLAARRCGIQWRVHGLAPVTPTAPASHRREALARAGQWLGRLPARLALEQEDALRAVAATCGYSAVAVERAFRARFWDQSERDHHFPLGERSLAVER